MKPGRGRVVGIGAWANPINIRGFVVGWEASVGLASEATVRLGRREEAARYEDRAERWFELGS